MIKPILHCTHKFVLISRPWELFGREKKASGQSAGGGRESPELSSFACERQPLLLLLLHWVEDWTTEGQEREERERRVKEREERERREKERGERRREEREGERREKEREKEMTF